MSRSSVVLFIHVPKAAGTTLTSIVDSHYKKEEICPAYYMEQLLQIPQQELSGYKLVRGHYEYSVAELLDSPLCLTMLRDPVERVQSYYRFVRSNETNVFHKEFQSLSILDVLAHPVYSHAVSNHQTLLFGRDMNLTWRKQKFESKGQAEGSRSVNKGAAFTVTPVRLDVAIERLNQFAFVGIKEKFAQSLMLMAYVFGWPAVRTYKDRNVTPLRGEEDLSTPEIITAIKEKNQIDLALYAVGCEIFERRYGNMKNAIAKTLGMTNPGLLLDERIKDFLDERYDAEKGRWGDTVEREGE